jgi:hypothetical protein
MERTYPRFSVLFGVLYLCMLNAKNMSFNRRLLGKVRREWQTHQHRSYGQDDFS